MNLLSQKKSIFFEKNTFILIVVAYFLLQVFQRGILSPTLSVDEAEQMILSQTLSFGYNEQPPLYTWLQVIFFQIFGLNVIAISLLKNFLLCILFVYYYKLSFLVYGDKIKSIAVALCLMIIPQIFWEAKVDQTHSVIVTTASVAAVYNLLKIFSGDRSAIRYTIFGAVCGLGILAKYNFAVLLASMSLAVFILNDFRKNILSKKIFFSLGCFTLVILPHFLWFIRHTSEATKSTIERIHHVGSLNSTGMISGLFDLMISTITFNALLIIVWYAIFRKGIGFDLKNYFKKYFLILFSVIYIFLIAVIICADISSIKERWLLPYLVFCPLILGLLTKNEAIILNIRILVGVCGIVAIVSSGCYLLGPLFIDMTKHPGRMQTPFVKLQGDLQHVINNSNGALLYAVNYFIGGNIRFLFPQHTVITQLNEIQAKKAESILVFYDKSEPAVVSKLQQSDFHCESGVLREKYLHSDTMEYSLKYQYCKKMS